jgi:hypothetical protein
MLPQIRGALDFVREGRTVFLFVAQRTEQFAARAEGQRYQVISFWKKASAREFSGRAQMGSRFERSISHRSKFIF